MSSEEEANRKLKERGREIMARSSVLKALGHPSEPEKKIKEAQKIMLGIFDGYREYCRLAAEPMNRKSLEDAESMAIYLLDWAKKALQ